MHLDIPTPDDIRRLAESTTPHSVSIFLRTDVVPAGYEDTMARAHAAAREAVNMLKETSDRRTWTAVQEHLDLLLADEEFWGHTGRSVAIFATPDWIVEYRLANELEDFVGVGDRFTFTPLLRALTFPHAAFVLALAQNSARLIEITPDGLIVLWLQ